MNTIKPEHVAPLRAILEEFLHQADYSDCCATAYIKEAQELLKQFTPLQSYKVTALIPEFNKYTYRIQAKSAEEAEAIVRELKGNGQYEDCEHGHGDVDAVEMSIVSCNPVIKLRGVFN